MAFFCLFSQSFPFSLHISPRSALVIFLILLCLVCLIGYHRLREVRFGPQLQLLQKGRKSLRFKDVCLAVPIVTSALAIGMELG